ncbi:tetratricopeptide repeat protein [Flavobacterium cerinum]|uniref:Tetratricopeptide repeat protein n=1 Tax=Flavobacterium cerinum TaxID=2502784 RepID=A0A444HF03_9FLAO|nr:tetratricopeptide repeat protein [Flavobacterium cerinum]RWX03470.1 tetratricopeptide repeat protein [Flavobacterium cerinum]
MLRTLFLLLITFCIFSCENKDPRNIKSTRDNNIVGDFDREKYPLIQKAIELGFEGNREEAIEKFDEAEKEYGQLVIISLNRGIIYRELEQLDYAIQDYTLCLKIDPNYFPALINRGITNSYLDNYEEAIADLNKAIKLDSKQPIGYLNLAIVYSMMNKKELVCENLTKATETDLNSVYQDAIKELEKENCE